MTEAGITKVFQIYIKATPGRIWETLTTPSLNRRLGYRGEMHFDLRPGGRYEARANADMMAMGLPEVIIDGEVVEHDAPRKLVHTYRFLFNEGTKAEGFTTLTWEIEDTGAGFCRVCITHDLGNAQGMAAAVSSNFSPMGGGGWGWILSDLKTLVETGRTMAE